jgi:hypothetical protein
VHPFLNDELVRQRIGELHRQRRRRPRREKTEKNTQPRRENNDFLQWVRSLPWVIERPFQLAPGVRTFAVDCPPLGIRRLWLVVGLGKRVGDERDVAVIVPSAVAEIVEGSRWGRRAAPMGAGQMLVNVGEQGDLEALVLTGYRYAMA